MPDAVLIDTNVLLDWLVFRDPNVRVLADAVVAGSVRWIVSPPLLEELEHVLTRENVQFWEADRSFIDRALGELPVHVPAVPTPPVPALRCTDADDQMFLDLALHVGARWLVSRDKALLRLARKAEPLGLQIVTPQAWTL